MKNIQKKVIIISVVVCLTLVGLLFGGYFCWMKKIENSFTALKFGFVTDFEYGSKNKIGNKLTNKAPEELEKVVSYYNENFRPEVVIAGGDLVESSLSKKNTTIEQFYRINDIFNKINAKKGYVFGNHDLRDLTKEELRNILGMQDNHSYFDHGDWRFVLMDTNYKKDETDLGPNYYIEGFVPDKEFNWLREAFRTDKPIILCSHHSPLPVSNEGILSTNAKNLSNGLAVHNFLKEYKNVVLVISGHDPSFRFHEYDGINYLIVDNLANIDSVGSFASMIAKFNRFTKEVIVEIEHYGPTSKKFTIEKKIGDFDFWKSFSDFNP